MKQQPTTTMPNPPLRCQKQLPGLRDLHHREHAHLLHPGRAQPEAGRGRGNRGRGQGRHWAGLRRLPGGHQPFAAATALVRTMMMMTASNVKIKSMF